MVTGAGDESVVPIATAGETESAREVVGRLRGGGRRPPHSAEAELAVLSAMVLDPTAIARVVGAHLAEDDFHLPAHRPIFRAIVSLFERRQAVDPLTLREELRRTNTLAAAGGDAYLGEVVAAVPTSANVEHHARIVLDYSLKRRLIAVGTRIEADAFERPEEADVLLDESEKRIFEIAERRLREGFVHIHRLLHRTIELIESLGQNPSHVTGVPSGFTDLDKMTAGFQLADLVIVAGRPSSGKTSLCLGIAQNASVRHDVPVAIFSLEMSKDQLVQRMLSSEARIDAQKMRIGALSPKEWQAIVRACDKLQNAKIYIDDTPALSILEMRAKARRLKSEIDLGLIVVDYLQLMEVGGSPGRIENRQQEISVISRSLKGLAKELNVPVVALSQLSRAPEQRTDHRPTLSDLRESGSLEQDSDLVLLLYRDEMYNTRSEDAGLAEVIVGKHRNGPTGMVKLSFAREFTRFDNHTPRPDF